MIKVLNASLTDAFKLELDFSDHTHGVFDANVYLASRLGPLLDELREPTYFKRFFIDAGAPTDTASPAPARFAAAGPILQVG